MGGSAIKSDWLGALVPADGPPGGIWIGFIRRTLEVEQSIVAVTVTGSLKFPMLASRRETDIFYRYLTLRDCCETAWSLPLLCQTDSIAMDAAGFSVVDNHAGVTFGVELYVPWDVPEMAMDLSAKGTVPLRNVQDVFGMCGRRKGVTESRILQGGMRLVFGSSSQIAAVWKRISMMSLSWTWGNCRSRRSRYPSCRT